MKIANERSRTICFTGHRPEKLLRTETDIKDDMENKIRQAIADGFNIFISGMSRGVDMWGAQIVLKLRSEGKNVKLICASPYKGFESIWGLEWQQLYNEIIQSADHTEYICEKYSLHCFQIRNEWMVDRSAAVIAVYNGEKGGTKNTVRYAEKRGVPVFFINS